MLDADIRFGMSVTVRAVDDFYQFIDGWKGHVSGWRSGYVEVKVWDDEIIKTFLVPPAQLEKTT